MSGEELDRALEESSLRPLPGTAAELLRAVGAPARLGAHLRAVHDVAVQILEWLGEAAPRLARQVDRNAVVFGAATHDIGKAQFPGELSGPGAQHERAGEALLLSYGVPGDLAKFAALHADWDRADATVEELLVTLADTVWKGRRWAGLEERVAERLAAAEGLAVWEAFMRLDDLLTRIADGADGRLAFQARFPVHEQTVPPGYDKKRPTRRAAAPLPPSPGNAAGGSG